jgi:hypothetical protein
MFLTFTLDIGKVSGSCSNDEIIVKKTQMGPWLVPRAILDMTEKYISLY